MKKLFYLVALMAMISFNANAQLKVNYNGTTTAGLNQFDTNYHIQMAASSSLTSGYSVGVGGYSEITTPAGQTAGVSCGVLGRAKNIGCGMTYGVAGELTSSSTSGAGVMGSTIGILGYIVPGKYAGYFYGNTHVNGVLTATQVMQSSDRRLKDNIAPLSDMGSSTLDRLLNINVVSFNYSPKAFLQNVPDSVSVEDAVKDLGIDPEKKHFGVIAQELQELYPELVEEGQDGFLKVNYIELVPILIRSVQELKAELDEIKGGNGSVLKTGSHSNDGIINTNGLKPAKSSAAIVVPLNVNGQFNGVKKVNR